MNLRVPFCCAIVATISTHLFGLSDLVGFGLGWLLMIVLLSRHWIVAVARSYFHTIQTTLQQMVATRFSPIQHVES
jgi:hypothetical protein